MDNDSPRPRVITLQSNNPTEHMFSYSTYYSYGAGIW